MPGRGRQLLRRPACRLSGILVRAFDVLDEYTVADLVSNPRSLKQLFVQK